MQRASAPVTQVAQAPSVAVIAAVQYASASFSSDSMAAPAMRSSRHAVRGKEARLADARCRSVPRLGKRNDDGASLKDRHGGVEKETEKEKQVERTRENRKKEKKATERKQSEDRQGLNKETK